MLTCKTCLGYGHCITNNDGICYTMAKTYLCSQYIANSDNNRTMKNNTYRFKKRVKESKQTSQIESKLDVVVKQLEENREKLQNLEYIIKLARALHYDGDNNDNINSKDSTSKDITAEVKVVRDKLPAEPPPSLEKSNEVTNSEVKT